MDNQTETDSAPRTKKSLGWLWWSLLGVGPVSYTHLTLPTTPYV